MPRRKRPGPKRKPHAELLTMTTMRLPKDLLTLLSRRAARHHLKRSELVRIVLSDYASKSDEELKQVVTNAVEAEDGVFG